MVGVVALEMAYEDACIQDDYAGQSARNSWR